MRSKVIVDLGFGDAGKGSTVDRLVRDQTVHTVVRFNGGAQAAHHVVLPDGTWHCFSQFGSGTLAGVATFLSRFVLVDPLQMLTEADELERILGRNPLLQMTVDRECYLVTPYHQAMNRAREQARGFNRHGSCGQGIGETMQYALETPTLAPIVGDASRLSILEEKLSVLRAQALTWVDEDDPIMRRWSVRELADEYYYWQQEVRLVDREYLAAAHRIHGGSVIFEGAQGVLLDEWKGFHPYTTWSTTTPTNALVLADEADIEVEVLGVCRSYMTRHGNGPFPTESTVAGRLLPEAHNGTGIWMGPWRAGHLDLPALRYAAACCERLDGLVVTHLDRVPRVAVCDSYTSVAEQPLTIEPCVDNDLAYQEELTQRMFTAVPVYTHTITGEQAEHTLSKALNLPVVLASYGPTWRDKIEGADLSTFAASSLA